MRLLSPHPTFPHGPHLVGLVEEAAPAPLEQELDVLINTAARKLSGQIVSVFTNTHADTQRSRPGHDKKIKTKNSSMLFCQ